MKPKPKVLAKQSKARQGNNKTKLTLPTVVATDGKSVCDDLVGVPFFSRSLWLTQLMGSQHHT